MSDDRKKYAYNYYIKKGVPPIQAAAIVGNLVKESNLDTSIKGTADNMGSVGIAQWHSGRLDNLKKFAGNNWTNLDKQLDFVLHELNTTEKSAFNKLMQAKTVEEATESFMYGYERPNSNPSINRISDRIKEARNIIGAEPTEYTPEETSTYKPYVSYLQENAGTIETAGKYSEPKEVTEAKKEIYQAQQEENFLEALSNLQQPQQTAPQQEQSYLENPELFQLAQVPQIQYEQFQKGGTWENQMLKVAREKAQKNLLKDKPSIQDLINDTKNRGKAQQLISKDNTNVKVNNRAENFSKVSRNKTDREIAEERRYKIDSSIKARESSYTKDNWRQKLAEETQATGDKFRVNLQPNFFDDYLNPAVMIGSMASNLGQAPLQAQQSDSILPYITSIGTPLAVGAMAGLGTQNTGQFVNNLANPLAGTGDLINNLGNKYLPNTYKLNPKAFKLNEENLYRQIGEQGYQDAVQTKVIRSADNKSYPNPYFAEAKDFDKLGSTGSGATGTRPDFIAEMPMVKEGELLAYPDGKGFWVAGSPQIPLEDVNLYKKDWLQGYKKMEQGGEIELQDNERAFLEEYFQDGGVIEEDKKWLENWYNNRVIPDKEIQEDYLKDKPYFTQRIKEIPSVKNVDIIDNDPFRKGRYDGNKNTIEIIKTAEPSTYLHEANHSINSFPSYMRAVHENVVDKNIYKKGDPRLGVNNKIYDYLRDPDEIHSRVQVLRKDAGFRPDEEITEDRLYNYLQNYKGSDSNILQLMNLTDEKGLLDMLNYMAYNPKKNSAKENYAESGGIIKDNNGYWNPNNWGKTVEISSPSITMKGVGQPLIGYAPETGETKIMLPGEDYLFNGANKVIESPLIK